MKSEEFKKRIEGHRDRMLKKNPLLLEARRGTLTLKSVEIYLHNAMFFFHHTPLHLERAKKRAQEKGMEPLASFFTEKIGEEHGHEVWPQNDLKTLGKGTVKTADLSLINPGTLKLLAYAKKIIDYNPVLFIPYMLYMEYITVLITPGFLNDLEKNCGIPKNAMTAIGFHAELDRDHVEDDLLILGEVMADCREDEIIKALDDTARYLEELTSECVTNV